MARYDVNIQDYWWILRKRRLLVIWSVVVFASASYLMGVVRAPTLMYESTASVKVERATDFTTLLLGTVSWTTWDNVATQSVIITSFPILEKTARILGRVPPEIGSEELLHNERYAGIIAGLRAQLTVQQESNTNIINITATATSPTEAQEIANTVSQVYQRANMEERNRKILETKEFIERQLKLQDSRLQESEEQLRKFRESSGLIAVDSQVQALLGRLSSLEAEGQQLVQKRHEAQRQLEQIQKTDGTPRLYADSDSPDKTPTLLASLTQKVVDLRLRKESLLAEYTPGHPEVKAVDAELKNLTQMVVKELKAVLADLDQRSKKTEEQIREHRALISNIPENAGKLMRLQREVEVNAKLNEELRSKYQEVLIQESGKIQEVTIVKPAHEPSFPINKPTLVLNAFTGGVIGLVLGIFLALVRESLDTSISTVEEISELLNLPVLGLIPRSGEASEGRKSRGDDDQDFLVVYYSPDSSAAEAYRSLRSHFQFARKEAGCKVVLVTSSYTREGKSYNSVNLALSLAQTGERILLIDADLRKPGLHRAFGIDATPGLTDFLWGNCGLPDTIQTVVDIMAGSLEMGDLLKTPGLDYLNILPAGSSVLNPWGVVRSPRFREMIAQVREMYDTVIIDSAPVLGASDTCEIAPEVDGVVLVYEVGRVSRGVLRRAKEQLESVHARLLGVVLNSIRPEVTPIAYQYYDTYRKRSAEGEEEPAHPARRLWEQVKEWAKARLGEITPAWGRAKKSPPWLLVLTGLLVFLLLFGFIWQNIPSFRDLF